VLLTFAVGWSISAIQIRYKVGFVIVAIILVVAVNAFEESHVRRFEPAQTLSQNSDSLEQAVPATLTNDAELLVNRCGNPDKVLDTSYDDPRPPIPTRLLTYRKAHLKIAFMPDAPMGAPPPYHWKLFGLIDTRSNKAVSASDLQNALQQRLPCLLENQK
jgi:hypothetical protein